MKVGGREESAVDRVAGFVVLHRRRAPPDRLHEELLEQRDLLTREDHLDVARLASRCGAAPRLRAGVGLDLTMMFGEVWLYAESRALLGVVPATPLKTYGIT